MARPRDFFAACSRAFAARPWACPQCGRAAPPPYAARAACACGHHWSLAATREALLRPFPALAAAADDAERARLAEPAALQAALAKVACACGHCRGEAVARDASGRVICQDCGCAVGDAASCPVCGADLSVPEMRYAPAARRCPECGGALAPSDGSNDGGADEGGAGGACPVCGAALPPAPAVSLGLWRCPQCGDELADPGAAPDFPVGQAYPLLLLLALAAGETGAFTGDDWAAAAALRPGLCDNLGAKATDKFSEANWRWLLCAAPLPAQVLSACPWRFAPAALREVATAGAPANRAACPWGGFPDDYWRELLAADAGFFAPRVPKDRWRDVLAGAGGAAARAALPSAVWRRLLLEGLVPPEIAAFEGFKPADWVALLAARPELKRRCECWGAFSADDWRRLTAARPEFADYSQACRPASAHALADVLAKRPELLFLADLSKLDGREWMRLLGANWGVFDPVCDWRAVAVAGAADDWRSVRDASPLVGDRLAAVMAAMSPDVAFRFLLTFPEKLGNVPGSVISRVSAEQWRRWLKSNPERGDAIPWAAVAPSTQRRLWEQSRRSHKFLRHYYGDVLDGAEPSSAVVAMVEALPEIIDTARRARCLAKLSPAEWERVLKANPRLGRFCSAAALPGILRKCPEAASGVKPSLLRSLAPADLSPDEWHRLFVSQPRFGAYCRRGFARLEDRHLRDLAQPGRPPTVRIPAQWRLFRRKAWAIARNPILWVVVAAIVSVGFACQAYTKWRARVAVEERAAAEREREEKAQAAAERERQEATHAEEREEADDDETLSLQRRAERGDAKAQFDLGACYEQGDGVEKDEREAVKWYRKAAEQGVAQAQYNLGLCYRDGAGVEQNDLEAVEWYRKAAEQGNANAQGNLSACYLNGIGVGKDEREALKWAREGAGKGNAAAQNNLGVCYFHGLGVEKDGREAVKWFRKATAQDYAVAQYNLGQCYGHGIGVDKDDREAAKWYRKAAEQGHGEAQCSLGNCYWNGNGVDKDARAAVEWWRKAAEQGGAQAQYYLGVCYDDGIGVEKDGNEAMKWFHQAAEQEYPAAQNVIGWSYYKGINVKPDAEKAFYWTMKAVRNGSQNGMETLFRM